jgi:hypothetical protein
MGQSVGEAATFTTPLSQKNSEVSRVKNKRTISNLPLPEAFRMVTGKIYPSPEQLLEPNLLRPLVG